MIIKISELEFNLKIILPFHMFNKVVVFLGSLFLPLIRI